MSESLPPNSESSSLEQPAEGFGIETGQPIDPILHAEMLRAFSPEYQAGFWAMVNAQQKEQTRLLFANITSTADLAVPLRAATDAAMLAKVLNAALALDIAENPKHKAKLLSGKLLNYYAFSKKGTRYRTFQIPKRTRGEMRVIKAPDYGLLRLQRLLLTCLTAAFTTCDNAAHGFVQGRSVLTNAQPHVCHHFILNLDLKDFFTSTHYGRVENILKISPFNLAPTVARLVANLCCDQGSLPQGAPTSPLLTNAVCQRLDRKLRQLAARHRAIYTRYADDLTFSSQHAFFGKKFHVDLNEILTKEGYEQNIKKQRLLTPNTRQEVTGIVVNTRPNVPRKYIREIRAMLHNWETKGYAVATANLHKYYKASKAGARHGGKVPKLEQVLAGKLAYLGMVRGEGDSIHQTLLASFRSLKAN